jgi:DNA-binding GntR family transcriptional regulator
MKRGLNLTEQTYERLRADLLACRIFPGEKLNIDTLSKQMSVSLGAIREALSRLTSEGLVTAERSKGFRATPISAVELVDLTNVRIEIESLCLRRSIANAGGSWEAKLQAAYRKLCRTPPRVASDSRRLSDTYAAAHTAYHEALVSACDSEWLLRIRRLLSTQSERYRRLALPLSSRNRDIPGEHHAIMDAALARDEPRTLALMAEHIQATTQMLLDVPILSLNLERPLEVNRLLALATEGGRMLQASSGLASKRITL